jgi:hypothetical protein
MRTILVANASAEGVIKGSIVLGIWRLSRARNAQRDFTKMPSALRRAFLGKWIICLSRS